MALDWKSAQENEKNFWKNIYVKDKTDDIYKKTAKFGWQLFAEQVLERNKIDKNLLNGKKILDLGSGPAGIAKGLHLMLEKEIIKNCKIIATDPLMDFFKKEISLLKEDENLKLLSNKGEAIELPDSSVDIILSTNVLDHCDNPDAVIHECRRILKPGGLFCPSVHVVYSYLHYFTQYIKYFDHNHPHHFTEKQMKKKLKLEFDNVDTVDSYSISTDQKNFTFTNIFKSKEKFRAIKRYLSNFIIYTCYFKIMK